jgi:hypothetical protein
MFLIFFQTLIFSQSIVLKGKIKNVIDGAKLSLISYKSDTVIFETRIIEGNAMIIISDSIQEGVYRTIISEAPLGVKLNKKFRTNEFDLIINKEEKEVEFIIDFNKTIFPSFIKSLTNGVYYDYKAHELKVINTINTSSINNEDVEKKVKQLNNAHLEFINKTNDYWTKLMISGSCFFSLNRIKLIDKELYWKKFDILNEKTLNSPLVSMAIRDYIIGYYASNQNNKELKDIVDNYKQAFLDVFEEFVTKDKNVNIWVKNYICKGILELKNEELLKFFKDKCLN